MILCRYSVALYEWVGIYLHKTTKKQYLTYNKK